jgi:molybdopterin molybdotransferase
MRCRDTKSNLRRMPDDAFSTGILRIMFDANCFIVLEHDRANVAAGELEGVQVMEGMV